MEKAEQIAELVSRFDKDKNFYQSKNYNETQLRSDFLDSLFEILGWDRKKIYNNFA